MLTAILTTGFPLPTGRRPQLRAPGEAPAGDGEFARAGRWLALFVAAAIVWTWPLARHLGSRIPHDPGDSLLNIWLIWWNARAVPFTTGWWSPPVFFPLPGTLALSEHLAGLAPLTSPLQWAGAGPVAAYNVAFILSFALSGFCAFLLVRRLAGGRAEASCLPSAGPGVAELAALVAGLVYGFGPYRAGQLAHLQVLTSQWMPLTLLAMHAWMTGGRRRWLLVAGAAWLLQALSNGYYLLFFPVLIALWLAWFVDWRREFRRGVALVGALTGASLPLIPLLLTYARVQGHLGLGRTAGEVLNFSPGPSALLQASGLLRFWPTVPTATTEAFLFPGVTAPALVAAAWIARLVRRAPHPSSPPAAAAGPASSRSRLAFYTGAAIVLWSLAFGAPAAGSSAWLHPWVLLARLPGYGALRVPARFAMLATLCASIAAGLAIVDLAPRRRAARRAFAALLLTGAIVDGWMATMPLVVPPGRADIPRMHGAAVLELPLGEGAVDTAAMYRAMTHRLPLVNGYSGHTPPHYAVLTIALRRGDPSAIEELARGRPLVILVNSAFDPGDRVRRLVEGLPGIQPRGGTGGGQVYLLPARGLRRAPGASRPWPAAARELRGFDLTLDLGTSRTVRTIGFPLRWHYGELDTRLRIQGSEDGRTWATVWEDWTGGPALAAAIESPLEAPVRLTVQDARMRYIRIYPATTWLQREIQAYGPE